MRWPTLRLEELAAREPGAIKIGPFGSQLKKSELVSSGVHVLGIENVLSGRFDDFGDRYITYEKFGYLNSVEVKSGDLLITMMGTIGKVCVVPPDISTSIMDSHLLRFRPNKTLCSADYVSWLIKGSQAIRESLISRAHGAIMKGLNSEIIRSLPAPLPPKDEQGRIVHLLGDTEKLVELRASADQLTRELVPALFHEMFGDPEHTSYPVRLLVDLVPRDRPITYGILKPGPDIVDGVPYVRVVDIRESRLHVAQLKKTSKEISEQYKRSKLEPGDVLITIRGSVGRTCIVPEELRGANITQDTARLAINPDFERIYLMEFLSTQWAQRWMRQHTQGQAVRGINLGDLKKIPVPVAPLMMQKDFAKRVEQIRELEAMQTRSRRGLDGLFGSMLHRAFNGEL